MGPLLILSWAWAAALSLIPLDPVTVAPAPATPLTAHLRAEYALTTGALLVSGLLDGVVKPGLGGTLTCRTLDNGARCDPAALWTWDRRSLGLRDRGWSVVSNAGQAFALGGSAAFVVVNAWALHRGLPAHDVAVDFVVLLESFVISHVAGLTLKYAVRRPRPQLYIEGGRRGTESMLSFPSGHTAATASSLTAASTIFWQRHPKSRWRFLPPAITAATTALVAYGRVATPKHFVSDVLAATALGTSVGLAVPLLHTAFPERAWQLRPTVLHPPEAPPAPYLVLEGSI